MKVLFTAVIGVSNTCDTRLHGHQELMDFGYHTNVTISYIASAA